MKGINIIYEGDDYIAVNKPAGLLTIPDRYNAEIPSLLQELQRKYGTMFTVHRLDKGTSGIVLFARNEKAHQHLSLQFEGRHVQKYYLSLVYGQVLPVKDTIALPIGEHPVQKGKMTVRKNGKPAITDYEVLDQFNIYSWLALQIHTGRTHQIRVHLQAIGHPVVADEWYGDGKPLYLSAIKRNFKLGKQEETERPLLQRPALHASRLVFAAPDGRDISLEAPLPKDLQAVLYQLRKLTKGYKV